MIRLFEMFAGYGGASFALKKANIPFECVGYSEIKAHAIKCYEANHPNIKNYGDVRKINPKELPDFDLLTAGFPCIKAGHLITTKRGLIPIEEITTNDYVLTHKNRFKKVLKIMQTRKYGINKVRFQGCEEIFITNEHPFYIKEMKRVGHNSIRTFSIPMWKETQTLTSKDFVGIGQNNEEVNEKALTKIECWLIGRYIADGYIQNNKRANRKNSFNNKVVFCIGEKKIEQFNSLTKNSGYRIGFSKERTCFKYRIINKRFTALCLDCGKGALNKKIPQWIIDLPKDYLELFLDGYMSGDGCCYKNYIYSATSISRILINQLAQIITKLYHTPFSITFSKRPPKTIIEGRIVNQKNTYTIRYSKSNLKQNNAIFVDNNLWMPLKSKEYINEWNIVYNIEVEEDNSYVVNNCIVHNCQAFSQAGKRKGFEDTRGTLFREIIRIAQEKKPKYMLLENVAGLPTHDNGKTFSIIIEELKRIGYDVIYKVLNSLDYGTPQSRERIWIFCKYGTFDFMEFAFPNPIPLTNKWKDYEDTLNNFKKVKKTPSRDVMRMKCKNITNSNYTYCISTKQDRFPNAGIIDYEDYYRFLTPKECFRLQGFTKDEINISMLTLAQAYDLAGNGWDINVASRIFKQIKW